MYRPHGSLELSGELHSGERIASEFEEVIVQADGFDTEHGTPDGR
jgi:hypothetical protein